MSAVRDPQYLYLRDKECGENRWRLLATTVIYRRVVGGHDETEAPDLLREMQELARDKGEEPSLLPSLDDLRTMYRGEAMRKGSAGTGK